MKQRATEQETVVHIAQRLVRFSSIGIIPLFAGLSKPSTQQQ